MKLGLLYEIQIPKPWTPGIEARARMARSCEQVVLADKLGWGYVWAVEHHLLPQSGRIVPRPRLLFGALSQVTKNIQHSVTASRCCRATSIMRCEWPSAQPCSTYSPVAGVGWGTRSRSDPAGNRRVRGES